jgi:S1-C subfamily serine protease
MMLHPAILGCLLACFPDEGAADPDGPLRRATVLLRSGDGAEWSGVVVAADKGVLYILTAGHAVEGADRLSVAFFEGEKKPARVEERARSLMTLQSPDVALVAVPAEGYAGGVLTLAPEDPPVGEPFDARSGGCDGGEPTVVEVRVNGRKLVGPPGQERSFHWEVEPEPARGRSGGPLADVEGRLLGICSGNSGGKGYYSTAAEIRAALDKNGYGWVIEE